MNLKKLVAKSGDSEFIGIRYDGSVLEIDLDLGEEEEPVSVLIHTNRLHTDLPSDQNSVLKTCRFEFDPMDGISVTNGYYCPASDFIGVMAEIRSGRSIAYGMKVGDYIGILSLVGYSRLVCCLVSSTEDIQVMPRI